MFVLAEGFVGPSGLFPASNHHSQLAFQKRLINTSTESKPHAWPWMANINMQYKGMINGRLMMLTYRCGGSLLRVNSKNESDIVLTAAHCVPDRKEEWDAYRGKRTEVVLTNIMVTLADHDRSEGEIGIGEQVIGVKNYNTRSHKDFKCDWNADLAILKLDEPIKFSTTISPISLDSSKFVESSSNCTVIGWGKAKYEDHPNLAPKKLQQLSIEMFSDSYCQNLIQGAPLFVYDPTKTLCAGNRNGSGTVCLGDSGGPLMCKTDKDGWVQHGITSRLTDATIPMPCVEPRHPQLFVKLSHYHSWIKNTIKELSAVTD